MRHTSRIGRNCPNFEVKYCEGCHVTSSFTDSRSTLPVTHAVAEQSRSMPDLLSASATLTQGWFVLEANGNDVGTAARRSSSAVPGGIIRSYLTGASSKAGGGCHRAKFIKQDDVNGLASFDPHTTMGDSMHDTSKSGSTWTSVTSYGYGEIHHSMSFLYPERGPGEGRPAALRTAVDHRVRIRVSS
jgi:hypothetical protein